MRGRALKERRFKKVLDDQEENLLVLGRRHCGSGLEYVESYAGGAGIALELLFHEYIYDICSS